MKLLLCIALVAIIGANALTNEQKQKLDKISQECKNQSGVSQDLIDKARKGEMVEDQKLKSHILCVSKKTNLATANGEVNVDVLKAKLKKVAANDAEVEKIVKKCAVKKNTPEQTAFEAYKCIHKEKPTFSVVD